MEETIDLKKLIIVLKKHFLPIVMAAVLCGGGCFALAEFVIPKKYESSALLYVENNRKSGDELNINDINAAQKLVNTCQIIFKSNKMLESVIYELDLPYDYDELSDMISVTSVNGTEVMRISASHEDPKMAADIVNVLVIQAQEEFMRVIKSGSIEVVEYAKVTDVPVFPKPLLFGAGGFILGAAAAYIIFLIIELMNVTITGMDDLSKIYGVPVFAEVPDFELTAGKRSSSARPAVRKRFLLDESTPFAVAESYRTARTNLLFSLAVGGKNIIAFTSANPGEGKSTTCANMAVAFSDMGKRVLLIDCDMRRPTVNISFEINGVNGLSSVLGGFCSLDEAVAKNVRGSLDVLPSGPIPPNPTELLGSGMMARLLEKVSAEYDFILLDTPPVNMVTDSQLMNGSIAGHVFVVKENSTEHPDVAEAMDKERLASGKILGFIKCFCTSGGKSSYGKKRYGRYGGRYGGKYGYYQSYGYEYKSGEKSEE
ncbi:MAG: polysaccharide biosynthesis tyrosine autokinase [Oscillospiraceae bacterium]|nr:polysaccharide biosynthesis tyrosine autokinase [Oscillospiraceae bacterium]